MSEFFNLTMPLYLFPLMIIVGFLFGLLWSKYSD